MVQSRNAAGGETDREAFFYIKHSFFTYTRIATMTKKTKITSPKGHSEVVKGAMKTIVPPKHMSFPEGAMPFFENIIQELPKAEWTNHTVELATKLAIAMYGHDSEAALFREEGAVIDVVSKKGTPVKRPNPRQSVVRDYVAEIEKLRKMIGINLRAKQGEKRDILKRRKIAKDIESKLPEDDDLFFKPSVN